VSWDYSFTERALKELKKLDRTAQQRILQWLDERIVDCDNPKQWGKELKGELSGLWRYRVGDYRVICQQQDQKFLILVLRVGHRRNIYG
jgi:mRNA interferase RelE/StbE